MKKLSVLPLLIILGLWAKVESFSPNLDTIWPMTEIRLVEETIRLIQETQKEITIRDDDKVTLFLGNTKVGVSTVVELLAGNHSQLSVVRNEEGRLVIEDQHDAIGTSFFSHTIKPRIVSRESYKLYVDLPGINTCTADNKNMGETYIEIVASHLLHSMLRSPKLAKIVLVVDEETVSTYELVNFFLNVRKLINNPHIYKEGMLLLVNKVTPREEVKITQHLKAISKAVHQSTLNKEELEFIEGIVSTLTQTEKRIAIVEVPTEPIESLADSKKWEEIAVKINNQIDQISFIHNKHFGLDRPAFDRSVLQNLVGLLSRAMQKSLLLLPRYVQEHYKASTKDITSIPSFVKTTEEELKILDSMANSDKLDEFMSHMMEAKIQFKIPNSVFPDWVNQTVKNIEMLKGSEAEISPKTWKDVMDEITRASREVLNWHMFLLDLYDRLSRFDIQTNRNRFNVKHIEDWGLDHKEQGLIINDSNFKPFLHAVVNYFPELKNKYGNFEVTMTEDKKNDLNLILERTLRSIIKIEVDGDTVYLMGDSVQLSSTEQIIQLYIKTIKLFSVMATESIIIDSNVNISSGKHLSIFAPKWVSNGKKYVIGLDGQDGREYQDVTNETDGRPGLPGGNGGNFIGYGEKSTNVNLQIMANGGRGGKGEDGAAGYNGTDHKENAYLGSPCGFVTYGHGKYRLESTWIYFDPLSCGGDGGNGGAGGIGGKPGKVKLDISIQENTNIIVNGCNGPRGEIGKGGKQGYGGAAEKYIESHCTPDCDQHNITDANFVFPPGKPGKDGVNDDGIERPATVQDHGIFRSAIHRYQKYIQSLSNDRLAGDDGLKLYQRFKLELN